MRLKTAKSGTSVDFMLMDAVMSGSWSSVIEAKFKDKFNKDQYFYEVDYLNTERVEFLDHLRRALRLGDDHEDWMSQTTKLDDFDFPEVRLSDKKPAREA